MNSILLAAFIPLLGTAAGSAFVFFVRKPLSQLVNRCFSGIAAGVMTAASVWSLLIPAMEQSEPMGRMAFLPAAGGFLLGILFLLVLDAITPHIHPGSLEEEGPHSSLKKRTKLFLAVTLHNIPEGMAVGATLAGMLNTNLISFSAVLALSLGIALQNVPEGAIISMPLHGSGYSRWKAFWFGMLSGAVEPLATGLTLAMQSWIVPLLPWFLSFAAGAMLYVVVEELIPEMVQGEHSNLPTLCFSGGFVLMMILDTLLG